MTMKGPSAFILLALIILVPVVAAQVQTIDGKEVNVIYQTTLSDNPKWIPNNPSTDYWDPSMGMYHFSIEPSTGSYTYIDIDYDRGPFILEYDVILHRMDEGTTFRLGYAGAEMDPTKGPIVLSMFTNAKYGKIMWLHVVTNSNKVVEVFSQRTVDEYNKGAYMGETAKYDLNKTYHVTIDYDNVRNMVSMKVTERVTGKVIWDYFLNTWEELHGMKRIYLGSKGDYGPMGVYAQGYIDNVRMYTPVESTPAPEVTTISATVTQTTVYKPTTHLQTQTPVQQPTGTPESPVSPGIFLGALVISALCYGLAGMRKSR